jgi:hypothetical protein
MLKMHRNARKWPLLILSRPECIPVVRLNQCTGLERASKIDGLDISIAVAATLVGGGLGAGFVTFGLNYWKAGLLSIQARSTLSRCTPLYARDVYGEQRDTSRSAFDAGQIQSTRGFWFDQFACEFVFPEIAPGF